MTSLNMGSMNFGLYPMLERYKDFKHDWERTHLENSRDFRCEFVPESQGTASAGAGRSRPRRSPPR